MYKKERKGIRSAPVSPMKWQYFRATNAGWAWKPLIILGMAWRRRRCRLTVLVYSVPVCVCVSQRRRCRLTVLVYSVPVCVGVSRRRRCRLNNTSALDRPRCVESALVFLKPVKIE